MRGDVPKGIESEKDFRGFSPHARGCSRFDHRFESGFQVFPACAGMFPKTHRWFWSPARFPRMRGDVPISSVNSSDTRKFSPHARGCSAAQILLNLAMKVFPACAGMFPRPCHGVNFTPGFPRMRGDVPTFVIVLTYCTWFSRMRGDVPAVLMTSIILKKFSPHARGCSSG